MGEERNRRATGSSGFTTAASSRAQAIVPHCCCRWSRFLENSVRRLQTDASSFLLVQGNWFSMSGRLTCYNLNCPEKEFDPQINRPDSCTFHPGKPKFHDAYKIWSCCNRKSTDFTEFLNFKGCTTGPHSNEKVSAVSTFRLESDSFIRLTSHRKSRSRK